METASFTLQNNKACYLQMDTIYAVLNEGSVNTERMIIITIHLPALFV